MAGHVAAAVMQRVTEASMCAARHAVTYHHYMRKLRPLWLGATLVLAAFFAAAPVVIAEGSLHIAHRSAPKSTAADRLAGECSASWRSASITASDGTRLAAWFFIPAEPNGGAVLLLHGVGDTRLGVTSQAELLLRAGYEALLPDSRDHGESGGDLVTYGVRESTDTAQWAQWMASQPGVERIYALGESMGAAVAIQSLALHPGFRAVVAECPFAKFSEIAEYRVGQKLFGAPEILTRPVTAVAFWYTRLRYGVDVFKTTPLEALRETTTPVLLIHGTVDTNIPPRQSRELHAANPQSTELWEVPGANHVAALTTDPESFRRRVLAWFSEH